MTLFLLITQNLVPAELMFFTLCSLMRKLLVIFIAAFGRSCPNVSLQQVLDTTHLGYVGTELNA